jgi:protein-L-isoaspartate(D-aspartate) O-methyltransferase
VFRKREASDWPVLRSRMVEKQLVPRGITDRRILDAMGELPREEFVRGQARQCAYADEPVAIGHGQTMSQPYMTAWMTQCLALAGDEMVLEIGAGCGYHTALLARLSCRVVAVERIPELAAMAQENLHRAGCANVKVICADGSEGWIEEAPYDAISVEAASPDVPPALLEQLAEGGRLVVPVGTRRDQGLEVIVRRGDQFPSRTAGLCRFVPLVGRQGWEAE